ncbi:hypothetical protein EV421DRAFT_433248 [Armillaria borealis]|uniref:AAA protein C-terminal winged helix domain-containing protein n=1 Tax=Armillaria borealis TaxID=47425 RepID=A0AA39K5D9_9AGAR|nr:hypothetical protein EV421DRAFT_433248 [Armillaria borealis]
MSLIFSARYLSRARAGHLLPRFYSQTRKTRPKSSPSVKVTPKGPPSAVSGRQARHEVQEGNAALNVPFNPPGGGGGPGVGGTSVFAFTNNAFLDAALTTVMGLGMVFLGGVGYLKWYKWNVLHKIEKAFEPGYDPALEVATEHNKSSVIEEGGSGLDDVDMNSDVPWTQHLRRKEQDRIDKIVQGAEPGHYFVLLGPKGSGKGTMIFDSMTAIQADGVAMCDAHPDLEVFRLRLGKALNYEYNEDSQTGLFQRRDPREGGPALDIERALNKLEKVALKVAREKGRPLVLIVNNVHYLKNDDDGRNVLLQLQQKAESWAASGILTLVFSTDDFWPFYVMRKTATRMHVLSIYDLDMKEALHACTRMRIDLGQKVKSQVVQDAVSIVGGRLSYLNKISKSKDMLDMAKQLLSIEKAWLLSQIGLITDCDDDVMDEQKWSSCSWLLLQEFVKLRQEQERELEESRKAGTSNMQSTAELPLPVIPYWKCRQIMTRADFLEDLDRKNIIAIDVNHDVRPDSMLILHAARQMVEQEEFEDTLNNVRDRIDEIESLHRTRELTFKDLDKGDKINLRVDKTGEIEHNV